MNLTKTTSINIASIVSVILFGLFSDTLLASEHNVKFIYGKRKEVSSPSSASQKKIYIPTDSSRQDLDTHISSDPSYQIVESGEVKPSGFSLPKIRGNDSKNTSLYLDTLKLTDPWTSYPIAADIDLRAFGAIETTQGFDSIGMENSTGSIRLISRPFNKKSFKVGFEHGDVFGLSLWAMAKLPFQNHKTMLYIRKHSSSGDYSFYNDNRTPLNQFDDSIESRQSNKSTSTLLIPTYSYFHENHKVDIIHLEHNKEKMVPIPSNEISNVNATENLSLSHIRTSYFPDAENLMTPSEIEVGLSRIKNTNITSDPEENVLFNTNRFEIETHSYSNSVNLIYTDTILNFEGNRSSLNDIEREFYKSSLHHRIDLSKKTEANLHLLYRHQTSSQNSMSSSSKPLNKGITVSNKHDKNFTSYLQASNTFRPPSILEQFGTGSGIKANMDLRSESTTHYEVGTHFNSSNQKHEIHFSYFEDETTDKIEFIQASGNSAIATNIANTKTSGSEIIYKYKEGRFGLMGALTLLDAQNISGSESYKIPRTPSVSGVFGAEYYLDVVMVRLFGKHRGDVYQDLSNKLVLPGFTTFDLFLDTKMEIAKKTYSLGFSVKNILDKKSVSISDSGSSASESITYISDILGYPLPGRTYKLSLEVNF